MMMALLKGFSPSTTISPGVRIPSVMESRAKLCDLGAEERFRTDRGTEFMMLARKDKYGREYPRAICYFSTSPDTHPGHVYGFSDDLEVTWLQEVYVPNYGREAKQREAKVTFREVQSDECNVGETSSGVC